MLLLTFYSVYTQRDVCLSSLGIWLKNPGNEDILALQIVFLGDAKIKSRVFYNCWSILHAKTYFCMEKESL